jgi:spermidine synthase
MNLGFITALMVAACSGFVALGYEIIWARLYSFLSGSRGEAFSAMLSAYLLGLAGGAFLSRLWQRRRHTAAGLLSARLLLAASALSFIVLPLVAFAVSRFPAFGTAPGRTLPLVFTAALALGNVLPLLCHHSIQPDAAAGQKVGLIYFANILGSGSGSLLTGFLLLDKLGSAAANTLLLLIGVLVAALLAWRSASSKLGDWLAIAGVLGLASMSPTLHHHLFLRLFFGLSYTPEAALSQIVETRHGVIVVDTNRTVYGNRVYDGVVDTKLVPGSALVRPYFISALHAVPREVLVVGVSGGAWTQILAHNPRVEKVTAVEINHGYLEVIRKHGEVASLLSHPKVEIVIDDARRWLQRHPQRRFDVIVMNTTFHWREFASALLSREFLELARAHLKPGGMVMWNCTGSARTIRTGMAVFPHAMMVMNNCVGSVEPLVVNYARWREVLEDYEIDGRRLFKLPEESAALEKVLTFGRPGANTSGGWRTLPRAEMERRYGAAGIITDENLGEEYRSILREGGALGWMLGPQ